MKPIKLEVSAFGPYKDKVEIDFTRLSENGIFLITGDTGSGKTTIFDAISYALYGEASGSRRDSASFRSDFALDEVNTYVKLEFEHKGITYNLERIPRYMRKKKRGDGFTSVGGDASLVYLDDVITGEKNVTEKCIDILGINANQFKQIVMIAQGEFLDLLLAKTKDRATIFRHIFNTGIYKNISDNLKIKYLEKKREYEDFEVSIKENIKNINLGLDLSGDEMVDQILVLLKNEIDSDTLIEKDKEIERKKLFDENSKYVKLISEAKLINDSINDLDKNNERLNILLEKKDIFTQKEFLLEKNKNIWDKIIPKYEKLINLEKELSEKERLYIDNNKLFEEILKEYNKTLNDYNTIDDKNKKIKEADKKIVDIEEKINVFNELKSLEKELNNVNLKVNYCQLLSKKELLSKVNLCKEINLDVDKIRDNISILKNEYVKDNDLYSCHYDLFLSAQAGILASNLKVGEPCPVCGSLDHPNKATTIDNVLSKEELDKEKDSLEKKYQKLEQLRLELISKEKDLTLIKKELIDINEEHLKLEINSLESLCKGISTEINSLDNLEKELYRLENSIKDKKEKIDDDINIDNLNVDLNNSKKIISELESFINNTTKKHNEILNEKIKLESLIKVLFNDIELLKEKILLSRNDYINEYKTNGYDSEDDYLKDKISKNDIILLEKEVNKYNNEIISLNAKIESLIKFINNREKVDINNYDSILKNINIQIEELNLYIKEVNSKISNNKKIYNNLKSVSEKTTKLEKEIMIYKDLSDTANGTIAGKSKLEFEQYVQANYFDRVLIAANKRFAYMTEDRYQLIRKEEATKISDKLGLELEIMDFYTGKKRDIKSLSGGESFKAALSLALGMSDAIQEFSGGVVVDAMFIDEGFGSLDDESLDQAMNAIMMLSKNNKMIGIISHVNELKNRIDKKIVVKKSSSGSSVSLIL